MAENEFKQKKDELTIKVKKQLADGNQIYKEKMINDQKYAESNITSRFGVWKEQRVLNKR